MSFLIFIPARSGSTRLKNKNIKTINNVPLIKYTIDLSKRLNIKDILIVTGHNSQQIRDSIGNKAKYSFFPNYKTSNNLQTLLSVKKEISGPFICLFADIFFDKKILFNLKKSKKEICLAIDSSKVLKNTMRIVKKNSHINDIGSHIKVAEGHGNFIGIAKFSKKGSKKLKDSLKYFKNNQTDYYTMALRRLIEKKNKVSYFDCGSLYWAEIDLYQDYIKLKKNYASK